MSDQYIPTEDEEQAAFVRWLQLRHIPHFRVPNETYTKSIKQRMKNKRLGVVAGVPDIFVIAGGQLTAIEMKRTKGSKTSPEQTEWIARLNDVDVPAIVSKGAEQAIAWVEYLESIA